MVLKGIMFIFLSLPVLYEALDDAEGDLNKKKDVIWRILLMLVMSFIVHLTGVSNFFIALNMAAAIFFLTFDYLIAYILIKNGTLEPPRGVKYHWWTYKAKEGLVDNFKTWRNLNEWVKLGIRVAYFIGALIIFL